MSTKAAKRLAPPPVEPEEAPDGSGALSARVVAARSRVDAIRASQGAARLDGTSWDREALVEAEAELEELQAAEGEQHRRDRVGEMKAEAKRQAERLKRVAALHEQHKASMVEAEAAARVMAAALTKAKSLGANLGAAIVDAGAPPPLQLSDPTWTRWTSWHLSAVLRPLATAGGRFGNVALHAFTAQPGDSWADATLAADISRITKGVQNA